MELTPAGFYLSEKIRDMPHLSKFSKLQCEPLVLHLAVAGTWACFCGVIEPFADGDGSSLNVQISMTAGAVLMVKQVECHETPLYDTVYVGIL